MLVLFDLKWWFRARVHEEDSTWNRLMRENSDTFFPVRWKIASEAERKRDDDDEEDYGGASYVCIEPIV